MKKILIPILFVLVLIGAGLALWALASNAGHTGNPRAVSGHSETHQTTPDITLPPDTTTTLAPAIRVPTTAAPRAVPSPTTTLPAKTGPVATTTTTTGSVVAIVAPTTTTAIPETTVVVQPWVSGVHAAPDGTECTATAEGECVLLTATAEGNELFNVYGNGITVGTFIPKVGVSNGFSCMLLLDTQPDKVVLSSFDCSGGPLVMQLGTDLSYSVSPA